MEIWIIKYYSDGHTAVTGLSRGTDLLLHGGGEHIKIRLVFEKFFFFPIPNNIETVEAEGSSDFT